MAFQPLNPDAANTILSIEIPKEVMPYLRDVFYPVKKREGETLEKYVVRVLSEYGIQVFLQEMSAASQQALVDQMTQEMQGLQAIAISVKQAVE